MEIEGTQLAPESSVTEHMDLLGYIADHTVQLEGRDFESTLPNGLYL